MVNILCVHWGNKYNGTYVNRLYRMVSKNLTLPFNFYCYSNNNFEYKNFEIRSKFIDFNLIGELDKL